MNIGKYLEEFSSELKREGYRGNSIEFYVSCVSVFLEHFNAQVTKPIEINEQQIKTFLGKFTGHNTQRAYHSAIKTFYRIVVRQPNKFKYIEYCAAIRKLPVVLSVIEMQRLINATENLKHKAIICLMYSTCIRISEVINLKISDVDSERMVIHIKDAKGGKDRQVPLDSNILHLLRQYYKVYKPKEYLFNGQFDIQYSERSVGQFLKKYAEKAGIKKRIYPHLIRHTSATHLLEQGTDMSIIQKILGHSNIKTTHLYSQISTNLISNVRTPIASLSI